ncbi:MAG: DUF2723 domain-containing protein [Chloroflexi bacterium]|nr:DUF2723 domain-containing protein [Chloroflexota bacterium]
MSSLAQQFSITSTRLVPVLAAITLGLYLSRLLAEVLPQWWAAAGVVGALVGFGAGRWLWKRFSDEPNAMAARHLLLLPLVGYIITPTFAPQIGLALGGIALLAFIIHHYEMASLGLLLDGVLALAVGSLYLSTTLPGLLPADAGEFQLVAATWGVAHPPGYPLYTMLAGLFAHALPAQLPFATNLFSALTMTVTVLLIARTTRLVIGETDTQMSPWAGLAAGLTFALATSVWSTATQASIRPLTAFFTVWCLNLLFAFRQAKRQRDLNLLGLATGLGLTHHPSLAFVGIFFPIFLFLSDRELLQQPRRLLPAIGFFALGFVPWVYLPLRGAAGATLAPEGLSTWAGFWDHVLARGFAGDIFFFRTLTDLWDRTLVFGNILTFQWSPLVLPLAGIAVMGLTLRDRLALLLLGGGFLLHSALTMTYRAPQTVEYLIPAYVCLALITGIGLAQLAQGKRPVVSIINPLLISSLMIVLAAQGMRLYPDFLWLRQDRSTDQAVEALLAQAEPNSLILANWHWAMPLQAQQAIDNQHSDVEVRYVFPAGAEPLAETWLRQLEDSSQPTLVTNYYPGTFAGFSGDLVPLDTQTPAWQALSFGAQPGLERQPASPVLFDNGLSLIAWDNIDTLEIGATTSLLLAWQIEEPVEQGWVASVQMLNEAGVLIAVDDQALSLDGKQPGDILVGRFEIGLPPYALPERYQITVGLYQVEGDGQITSAQGPLGQPRHLLSEPEADLSPLPAPTANPRQLVFANGARLRGYDWEGDQLILHGQHPNGRYQSLRGNREQVLATFQDLISGDSVRLGPWGIRLSPDFHIPGPDPGDRYVSLGQDMLLTAVTFEPTGPLQPGDNLTVDLTLRSTRPLLADRVIKVDLIGPGYAWRSQSDHIPATGAIPTLKWLSGTTVHDRHRLSIPTDAPLDSVHLELLVYDHFTNLRLPLLDPELAAQGIVVRLHEWPARTSQAD